MTIKDRIDYLYNSASIDTKKEGALWYSNALSFCIDVGKAYYKDHRIVAGILAAFSPMKEWELNKKMVVDYLEEGTCKTFSGQYNKASLICGLDSEIVGGIEIKQILRGLKTTSFYENIVYPYSNCVTVDSHMFKCLTNYPNLTRNRYIEIGQSIIDYSSTIDLYPCQLQSTIWLEWKKKSLKERQLLLNNWNLVI